MLWRRRRRPQPQTVQEAIELFRQRLGPAPGPHDEAAVAEWKRRIGPEIEKAEFELVRHYIDRVFSALAAHDDPCWNDETFDPACTVDWETVLGDLPGYVPGSGPGWFADVASQTFRDAARERSDASGGDRPG